MAQREPRRAWKWLSHSGRPSCSKKLPPEKGAKHSCGRTRGEVSPHTHTPDTTPASPVQPPVALADQHQTSPTNPPHPHLGTQPSQVLSPHSSSLCRRSSQDARVPRERRCSYPEWGLGSPGNAGRTAAGSPGGSRGGPRAHGNLGDRKKPMCNHSGVLHHLRPEARGWAGRGWWCTTKRGLEGTGPVGLSVRGGEQKGPGKLPKRSWLGQRARLGISKVHGLLMQKPSSYPHLRKVPHN